MRKLAHKRPVGRPGSGWRVYDSLAACAGATGIPASHLSLMKATGCKAFRWSKVFEQELFAWIAKYNELDENNFLPSDANVLACRAERFLAAGIRRKIDEYRDAEGMPHWPWIPADGNPIPTPLE
jgi:hypothetical protein